MCGVESPARTLADFYLIGPSGDETSLLLFKLFVRSGAELVFDGIGSRIRITRHGLAGLGHGFEPRYHL
jgi:hypothetical protein